MMTQRARNPLKRTQRRSESLHCFTVDLVLSLSEYGRERQDHVWSLIWFESHRKTLNCVQESQCVRHNVEITFLIVFFKFP